MSILAAYYLMACFGPQKVWDNISPPQRVPASFSRLDGKELLQRIHLCDLLFVRPRSTYGFEFWDPYFFDYDSVQDDLALEEIWNNAAHSNNSSSKNAHRALMFLIEAEYGSQDAPRVELKVAQVTNMSEALLHVRARNPRARLLRSEASALLMGLYDRANAAKKLIGISNNALNISPLIAQTAMVHAIYLYRLSGKAGEAQAVFRRGKQLFLKGNPTNYRDGFWTPKLERVQVVEWRNGRVKNSSQRIVPTPHLGWRF